MLQSLYFPVINWFVVVVVWRVNLLKEKLMVFFFSGMNLLVFNNQRKVSMCHNLLNSVMNQTATWGYSVLLILNFTAPTRLSLAHLTPLCNCQPLFASSFFSSSALVLRLPPAWPGQVTDWLHPFPTVARQSWQAWTLFLASFRPHPSRALKVLFIPELMQPPAPTEQEIQQELPSCHLPIRWDKNTLVHSDSSPGMAFNECSCHFSLCCW